jgi:hypothetical protein
MTVAGLFGLHPGAALPVREPFGGNAFHVGFGTGCPSPATDRLRASIRQFLSFKNYTMPCVVMSTFYANLYCL